MTARTDHEAVLFRVAGGAQVGSGHVMRALSLARALDVLPRLSIRGGARACAMAADRGAIVDACRRAGDLASAGIRLLVVDDPSARAAAGWVGAARRLGIPTVSLHDLGLARVDSDLAVDGSMYQARFEWPSRRVLTGTEFAVLDPEVARLRAKRDRRRFPRRVVVALGGGATGRAASAVGAALKQMMPASTIVVAPGGRGQSGRAPAGVRIVAPAAFRRELARSSVAIVSGGISLTEACAMGIAAVGVAVVAGQAPAVRAFARRGLAVDGGTLHDASKDEIANLVNRVASHVTRLLDDDEVRERLCQRAMAAIDGRGAERVAAAARELARVGPPA
jgi:spore coat polysaccharide biosynthesis predicted glycosyltransferase SpsG